MIISVVDPGNRNKGGRFPIPGDRKHEKSDKSQVSWTQQAKSDVYHLSHHKSARLRPETKSDEPGTPIRRIPRGSDSGILLDWEQGSEEIWQKRIIH